MSTVQLNSNEKLVVTRNSFPRIAASELSVCFRDCPQTEQRHRIRQKLREAAATIASDEGIDFLPVYTSQWRFRLDDGTKIFDGPAVLILDDDETPDAASPDRGVSFS